MTSKFQFLSNHFCSPPPNPSFSTHQHITAPLNLIFILKIFLFISITLKRNHSAYRMEVHKKAIMKTLTVYIFISLYTQHSMFILSMPLFLDSSGKNTHTEKKIKKPFQFLPTSFQSFITLSYIYVTMNKIIFLCWKLRNGEKIC